ncbi:MAG: HoxN/HupN/NixA family nickel/cobalt transporter [Candidatus Xenobia bacterium]
MSKHDARRIFQRQGMRAVPTNRTFPQLQSIASAIIGRTIGEDAARLMRHRNGTVLLLGLLLAFNAIVFMAFRLLYGHYPFLFSLGLLAYVFGLRHAADADHIAAIDNTTRKLMHDGRQPLTVGLYFSLGHSTIVFLLSLGLAVAAGAVKTWLPHLEAVGGMIGTVVSAAFLFLIAALNLVILKDLYRAFLQMRGVPMTREKVMELEQLLLQRGLMNRVLGKAYNAVRAEWQMYPIGVLFGLGFDTASEVALLGMSAFAAGRGMPVFSVLILPLLFAAAMSLVDTLDGILMQYAYAWAFLNPVRKIYYNLTVTSVSVLAAVVIGSVEWLQVIASQLGLDGPFWSFFDKLNFEVLGYFVIGLLLGAWILSVVFYKISGIETRWTAPEPAESESSNETVSALAR